MEFPCNSCIVMPVCYVLCFERAYMSDGEMNLFMLDKKCCIDCGHDKGVEFYESHPSAIYCKRCHSIYYAYSENGPHIIRHSKFKPGQDHAHDELHAHDDELYRETTFVDFIDRLLRGVLNELPM